jgi:hypothetical protein
MACGRHDELIIPVRNLWWYVIIEGHRTRSLITLSDLCLWQGDEHVFLYEPAPTLYSSHSQDDKS